jgi:hypothetical protein
VTCFSTGTDLRLLGETQEIILTHALAASQGVEICGHPPSIVAKTAALMLIQALKRTHPDEMSVLGIAFDLCENANEFVKFLNTGALGRC